MIVPRAVSLCQPAATLIAAGAIETIFLPWGVDYRGRILIHAAMRWEPVNRKVCNTNPYLHSLKSLGYGYTCPVPRGEIVGSAELVSCLCVSGDEYVDEMNVGAYRFLSGGGFRSLWAWTFAGSRLLGRGLVREGEMGLFRVAIETYPESIDVPKLARIPPPNPPLTILQLGWKLMGS